MNSGKCQCGCNCSSDTPEMKNDAQCNIEATPVVFDEEGKCQCGKSAANCCRKDEMKGCNHDDAIGESCESCGSK